jgi:hypothetical protein
MHFVEHFPYVNSSQIAIVSIETLADYALCSLDSQPSLSSRYGSPEVTPA